MRHISMLSTFMLTTFFLFAMVWNTSTTVRKSIPHNGLSTTKKPRINSKKWVNVNQLKSLKLDTVTMDR